MAGAANKSAATGRTVRVQGIPTAVLSGHGFAKREHLVSSPCRFPLLGDQA